MLRLLRIPVVRVPHSRLHTELRPVTSRGGDCEGAVVDAHFRWTVASDRWPISALLRTVVGRAVRGADARSDLTFLLYTGLYALCVPYG